MLSRSVTVSNTDSSRRMTRALVALSLGCFLHLTTLPGSSFIEEEHQIWHFLTASVSLFVFVAFLRTIAQIKENAARERPKSSLYNAQFNESASLMRLRKGPDKSEAWTLIRGAGGDNTAQNGTSVEEVRKISNPPPHKLPVLAKDHYKYVGVAFATVISHRLLRAWNQTGIKHADEPDIGKFYFILLLYFHQKINLPRALRRHFISDTVLFTLHKNILRLLVCVNNLALASAASGQ